MSRLRYERFIGHGNFRAGGMINSWKIECSRCPQVKIINARGKNSSLPPDLVIKKLSSKGWHIGNKGTEDLCPDCQRKPEKPQSNIDFAKKALAAVVAPMVGGNNGQRFPFTELLSIAKTLEPDQAKELIAVLRERLPVKVPKVKPPKPLPPSDDEEYERWLSEQK